MENNIEQIPFYCPKGPFVEYLLEMLVCSMV